MCPDDQLKQSIMTLPSLIAANWKMHGSRAANTVLLDQFLALVAASPSVLNAANIVLCAPFPYLADVATTLQIAGSSIAWGAQDVSAHAEGAYTGEVSASMLADLGCQYVIVGHSERRREHGESDALIAAKAQMAYSAGLCPIVCLGETLKERQADQTLEVIDTQINALLTLDDDCLGACVIAYEPVWAIGTGRQATPGQAQTVHSHIRQRLTSRVPSIRLLYGGSVKPDNATELFAQPDIDGGLIGGASLDANSFFSIIAAVPTTTVA